MQGQRIIHASVDSVVCPGDSVQIRVGFAWGNEVVLENPETSISHPGRVFLPDGIPCGDLGCSYRSPVTFSGFAPNMTINSANDINYIRLNMEHSWIGDIYIGITCPNGQKASLMNFSGSGASSCSSTIPAEHHGWSGENNVAPGAHFGIVYDSWGYSNSCDSLLPENQPGTGWNYCWSNNTSQGYSYAHATPDDDGIIYRLGHEHDGIIDSSDVVAGTNFYHPEQNFSALIGCPLNGDWYIEVLDGWSGDNGYIFDWEMSLNDIIISPSESIESINVLGNEVTRTSDSSFLVSAPAGSPNDTTVEYTVVVHTSSGDDIDTVVSVHYTDYPRIVVHDSLCLGDTIWVDTLAITETRQKTDTIYRPSGCAIIRDIDVVFSPSYHFYDTAAFCYSEYYVWHDIPFASPGDYNLEWQTAAGCDSVWHVSIIGRDIGFDATPLISDDGETWSTDTMLAGCQPMTVWMKSGTPHAVHNWWNWGDTLWYDSDSMSHVFDSVGIYTLTYITESEHGCRDTAELDNAVWVFGKPEAAFIWSPEYPTMSHPEAAFFNQSTSYTGSDIGLPYTMDYLWSFQTSNGYDSVREESPYYSWSAEGENVFGDFTVLLTTTQMYTGPYGDPAECEDTSSATITILNDWLQFPNMVSPNGDGVNDIWKVVNLLQDDWVTPEGREPVTLYLMNELWIYNKWGTLVYHVKDISKEEDFWDPQKTNSPDGTYFFRFSAKSQFGIVRTNGEIEVVR